MSRRQFLQLSSSITLTALTHACVRPAAESGSGSAVRVPIRGVCFDLFTLFDPRGVIAKAATIVGDGAEVFCETWRTRQFQYGFIRAAAGVYVDFRQVTEDALVMAAKTHKLSIAASDRERLVQSYSELELWPDSLDVLKALRSVALKLAPLANYAPSMLEALIDHAKLQPLFDDLISTDAARTFKPDPKAYALGPTRLGLAKEEIVFCAFGGWDAAGASWFGFPTMWVNRLDVPQDVLTPGPTVTAPSLLDLDAFIKSR